MNLPWARPDRPAGTAARYASGVPAGSDAIFSADVLEISVAGGVGGGSAEIGDGAGAQLGVSGSDGVLSDPDGTALLSAGIRFDGRADKALNAMLQVLAPDGSALGEVRLRSYTVTPRSRRASLSLQADGEEVARLETTDKKGEQIEIGSEAGAVAAMRKLGKKGLIRSTTAYRLEWLGAADDRIRRLVVAAAINYDGLIDAAATAGR